MIHYQEYIPSNSLLPYIDSYWVAKNNDDTIESRILPDGFIDIIFDINGTSKHSDDGIKVSGMMTKYRDVMSDQNAENFGIRFKAGQFSLLSNFPFSEIKNNTINISKLLPAFNPLLLEELIDRNDPSSRIKLIESVLINQLSAVDVDQNSLITSVCAAIKKHYKAIDLVQIANQHFVSLRQLERRFKVAVGVTMKEYHSIIRFKKTLECISKKTEKSLLHIAFDNGYFDHAHLTKDILKMAGVNPSQI
ncbi:MAG: helix-turn-helix domain-containing protein [Chitinophagales bacterium]|nr:helix-turn-helix domain-containing protein [Chitinophagales bacterium]